MAATTVDETLADAPAAAAAADDDLQVKLEQLKASATKEYSLRNYDAAAELYSEAAQVQDQINDEMHPDNADLLYQYGRCLYHVAVSNSDVLGGKVAGSEEPKRKRRKVTQADNNSTTAEDDGMQSGSLIADAIRDGDQKIAEELVEAVVEDKGDSKPQAEQSSSSNPYFQITGDENFTDSEDDENEDGGSGEAEGDEDDFATAYEILDMARLLLARKLEQLEDKARGDGKDSDGKADVRQLKERLADTHDLQSEISLENERFQDAIKDTRDALTLKMQLYPQESSLIAEAHFKLSLALEFASVTSIEETPDKQSKVAQIDEEMRREAAAEMELAIASCKLRVAREEGRLSSVEAGKAVEVKRGIADVTEMISEMEQRLDDLRKPAVSLSALQGPSGPAGASGAGNDPIRGILGEVLGESKAEQAKRIQEATQNANDLTGMVKKKKMKQEASVNQDAAASAVEGKGKRKADGSVAGDAVHGNGKKVKFDADVKTGEEETGRSL